MKISCERKALAAVLGAAVRIIDRRATIPILSNVMLVAEAGSVFVTADNLNMRVVAPVAAEVEREGGATLPASILHDVVKGLADGARVTLDAPEGERAVLRSGRSRSTLATLPLDHFPPAMTADFPHSFKIDGKDLARALERCLTSVSTDASRDYLNGVYIHASEQSDDEPTLRFVATDGHRMVLTAEPLPPGAEGLPGVILPRLAAIEVQKLAGAGGMVLMEASPARLSFTVEGGLRFITRAVDGTFPDYERVIPRGNSKHMSLDRASAIAALDRVASVRAAEERRGGVKVAVSAGRVVLTARTELNEAVEELDAETEADIEIGFNPAYLQSLLRGLDGERATLALEDPGSPALINAVGDTVTTCVLMPMRV